MGTRLAFAATKNKSVEIVYSSYKNLRYNFAISAEKINAKVLVPSFHDKACDFVGFVEYFFLKLFTKIFPFFGRSKWVDR